MAKFKTALTLKVLTTKDGETEDQSFAAGDDAQVLKEWDEFYLVKAAKDGQLYTVRKQHIES